MTKFKRLNIYILSILLLLVSPFFVMAKNGDTFDDYAAFFYNRYSLHLDEYGSVYSVPNYGIKDFKNAENPRELMSLALYYRYRALNNDLHARDMIRQAILRSNDLLNSTPPESRSFEDATAQFLMWQALEGLPLNFTEAEKTGLQRSIIARAKDGLLAGDTSNRAALSAAYWQFLVKSAFSKNLINASDKDSLGFIIKNKIDNVRDNDIDKSGWYIEGSPKRFNPHYHLITALAFALYGESVESNEYMALSKKMVANLRKVTFKSGMVESSIGDRPIGLGAQFYFGAGVLNWKFGYKDYGAYLNFAKGNTFFSDQKYPNRLEYHATRLNEALNYHDDYAFSNLAEMVFALKGAVVQKYISSESINSTCLEQDIENKGNEIIYKGKKYNYYSKNLVTVDVVKLKSAGMPTKLVSAKISKASNIDTDKDGLSDQLEIKLGTNPRKKDSDGDGYSDGLEWKNGYDPLSHSKKKRSLAKK